MTVSFKAFSVFSFLEIWAQNFSFRLKAFLLAHPFCFYGVQFVMAHTLYGKSLSPSSGVAILAKTRQAPWKRSKLRLERIGRIGGGGSKITDASAENVGNGHMSLMSGVNTNDRNQLDSKTSYSLMMLT